MKTPTFLGLGCSALAIALVSCNSGAAQSDVPSPLLLNSTAMAHADGKYRILFEFDGKSGKQPEGNLIKFGDVIYGTTSLGGDYDEGTVYSITATGNERVLHSFRGHLDGGYPIAGLTALGDGFYGTTSSGGYGNAGTIFVITPAGKKRILYRFNRARDGSSPGGLTVLNGALYGISTEGGATGSGTVFSVTTSGKVRLVYTFRGPGHWSMQP
jgi:uncharacterized repeat protein (TIGR03803 family)